MRIKLLFILFSVFAAAIHPQKWKTVGYMQNSVYGAKAIVKGDNIYILGGFSEFSNSAVSSIQVYNPLKNTWKDAAKMNSPRFDFIADVYKDKLVYFGGISGQKQNFNALEIWDFNSEPLIYDTNLNFNRQFATGLISNGKIYIFGGQDSMLPYMVIYDIATAKVIHSSNFAFGFQFPLEQMSVISGSNIYLFGGSNGILMNAIYKLDTTDNSFKVLPAELKRPRAGGVAVSSGDSLVYIIGGFDETHHALSSVEMIKITGDEIETEDGPQLNYPRTDPVVVNYNNSIYVFGGLDKEGQPVSAVERLDVVTAVSDNKTMPAGFELENNYPNPFNPSTNISFNVSKTSNVSLDIYSVLGQHVKSLTSKVYSPGQYTFNWNGTDNSGRALPSGIYIYTLISDYFSDAKKMILLK